MHESKLKGKVISGVFWKFAERVLAQLVSFIVSVILARILLPEDYGIIALILIFITIADVFVTSGFSTALIQNKEASEIDFSTNFYCSFVVAAVLYIVLFLCAPYIAMFYKEPLLTLIVRIFSLRLFFAAYNSIQHAYVSRHMLFKRFFFSTLFGTIISGIVGIIMALHGFGVWALVAQYMTNTIVDIIVLNFTVPWHPQLMFSWSSAKSMMSYGWKVLAADLIGTFFEQLRSLLVGKVYTPADLAYYNKGQQLPSLITNNLTQSIMSVLFPAISNVNETVGQVKSMLRRSVKVISYVMFPLLFGLAIVAKPLTIMLFTEKWIQSVPYIQLLAISSVINLLGNTSLQTMKAIGRSDVLLSLEFIKKPVFLFLLIIGIRHSVLGVAITTVIYAVYSNSINACQLKKLVGYSYIEQFSDIVAPAILSISMVIFLSLFTNLSIPYFLMFITQVIVGICYYLLMSKIFKVDAYIYLMNYLNRKIIKRDKLHE